MLTGQCNTLSKIHVVDVVLPKRRYGRSFTASPQMDHVFDVNFESSLEKREVRGKGIGFPQTHWMNFEHARFTSAPFFCTSLVCTEATFRILRE